MLSTEDLMLNGKDRNTSRASEWKSRSSCAQAGLPTRLAVGRGMAVFSELQHHLYGSSAHGIHAPPTPGQHQLPR